MGKFASAVEVGPPRAGHWCALCEFIEGQDPESREEAKRLVADNSWTGAQLIELFAPDGFKGDWQLVANHRRSRAARG